MKHFPRLLCLAAALLTVSLLHAEDELSVSSQFEFDVIKRGQHEQLAKISQANEELRQKYLGALQKHSDALKAAKNQKLLAATDEAITAFQGGPYTEGVDPTGFSPDPDVASLGKLYLKEHQKLLNSVKERTIAAWQKYHQDLEGFVAKLQKDGKSSDAQIAQATLKKCDEILAQLAQAGPNDLPESQGGWDGIWDVTYAHGYNRKLKITQTSPTELSIQAMGGWAAKAKYKATFDPSKGHFIANHVEEPNTDQRQESYIFQNGRILMRHFHDKYPYEKPEAPAVARPSPQQR